MCQVRTHLETEVPLEISPMLLISPNGTWHAMTHTPYGWREPLAKSRTRRAAPAFILIPSKNRYTLTSAASRDDSPRVPSTRVDTSRKSLLWRRYP